MAIASRTANFSRLEWHAFRHTRTLPLSAQPLTIADIDESQRDIPKRIRSWHRFHRLVRRAPGPLLETLDRYERCVLVAGCQRSGTTMLTRIIARSDGFRSFGLTHDDELDAALILSGRIDLPLDDRYCFQTTYLNERYPEYASLDASQRLIWLLRNPYSVVYSMVYHWRRFAFDELYESCVGETAPAPVARARRRHWPFGLARIERACIAYAAKTSQVERIADLVPRGSLMILDYDQVVNEPQSWLPDLFSFIGGHYAPTSATGIKTGSLRKQDRLTTRERALVAEIAWPTYERCLRLVSRKTSMPSGAKA
jgi:Sulfotransferase domain